MTKESSLIHLARPTLAGNEKKYLTECIETGFVTHHGRFEGEFEKAFSERFGKPSLATSSGTGALHLALLSLGVGPGDDVIVPDLTFGATISVVLAVGARPVLVDIRRDTWGLDKDRIFNVLTKKTRAIVSVALYGLDAGELGQFGVPVIEDNCEALGTAPMRGKMTAFSFYGNKTITTGEGGMLCGDFGNAGDWRDGGFDEDYRHTVAGLNYRMSNLQAALGLAQLERFDELLELRLRNAGQYAANLPGRGKWLFCVETNNPRGLQAYLKDNGVESRPIFTPMHLCPAFRVYAKGKYKVAEEVWMNHLALPTGPHVSPKQVEKIVGLIHGSGHLHKSDGGNRHRTAQV